MNKKMWNKEKIDFLIKNYPKTSVKYCSNKLNLSENKIIYQVRKLKLKINKSLCEDSFINIVDKEMCYILGFMWADGHLSNDNRHFNVSGSEIDIKNIENLFDKYGNWCKHYDDRSKYGWKNALTIIGSNKRIYDFLKEHDYHIKSITSPDKILSKIPDELKYYFYRGLVDGDGCFYFNLKNGSRQFTITSSYEQDWSFMINLCNELDIKYSIRLVDIINKKTGKQNKSSQFRITNKRGIGKIGEYIYKDYDGIGLSRKYEKYLKIIN